MERELSQIPRIQIASSHQHVLTREGPPMRLLVDVVRGYFIAKRPIEELEEILEETGPDGQRLVNPSEISFTELAFLRKSDQSKASAGKLIPIGGKIEDRTPTEAALFELGQETSLTIVGFLKPEELDYEEEPNTNSSYAYDIPDYDEARRVYSVIAEVDRTKGRFPDIIDPLEDKAEGVEFIALDEAVAMIRGHIPSDLVDHCVIGAVENIGIDPTNSSLRDEILDDVCARLEERERRLKEKIVTRINTERVWQHGKKAKRINNIDEAETPEILTIYQDIIREDLFHDYRQLEKETLAGINGYTIERGKVYVIGGNRISRSNVLEEVDVLDDGSIISSDGTLVSPIRDVVILHPHQCVSQEGKVFANLEEMKRQEADGYLMKADGTLVVVTKGETAVKTEIDEDEKLQPWGGTIAPDGTITTPAGHTFRLQEGQVVTNDGIVLDREILRNGLGYLYGKDIFYFAYAFANEDLARNSSLHIRTTKGILHALNFLKRTLRSGIAETKDITQLTLRGESYTGIPLEKGGITASRLAINLLQDFYREAYNEDVRRFEDRLTAHIDEAFMRKFELTPQQYETARRLMLGVLNDMVDRAHSARAEYVGDVHLHRLMPLISNANTAKLMMLALGIMPHRDHEVSPEMNKLIRFEASKTIATLLHSCAIVKRYCEIVNPDSRILFDDAITEIFGAPVDVDNRRRVRLLHHDTPVGLVAIDRVDDKGFEPFERKALETYPTLIRDGIRYVFVNIPEGEDASKKFSSTSVNAEISRSQNLIRYLIGDDVPGALEESESYVVTEGRLREVIPEEYTIEIVDRRNTYHFLRTILSFDSREAQEDYIRNISSGKRTGSKGHLWPREKFKILISRQKDDGTIERHEGEFTFVPVLNFSQDAPEGVIDQEEKMEDNARYYWVRLFGSLTHNGQRLIAFPSVYELLYPWPFYEQSARKKPKEKTA
ncbi:hypothetical protein A3H80_04040 [Candidatus Roizmanbacteria bacterium RIFCSPLOWO2_02_FULL_37_19]|uniref:DUF6799 domain-containing protein n=1 Tax=Candidatus Roizmanbacteria bacterium RIFCSPHIGHO2_02_FULL_37_24 TaxID=1802037 RepID=A0A1F7GVG9_9BACT|nr:MAG: hypothetical protein A2862_01290 [Candidatus Roizmanbacteria bacterium RIFCSPHIGHO2_01_FULL_38_41]OGK23087.1 MAG: hypothetical protein A3C24_04745 [Candidatus Roizmanbacteria bacterium RIFCSPHIGHO2_02_FULL_37_24]OGK33878.1 MAG: hypothetical protein A3E10_01790 [Candidatus Roizmanbacteria bacterium RIFCSPHIGHO2_12_FULL_37_23]OGK45704.1 MAG: hypothetical protein A2956_01870 [Candidatus Roizmanbacteria bacterium RIFCSPLOWO2_01_FULL_37_57]OGK53704.1 MAG: hypothetical protein A3H80_04040 [Ca